MKLREDTAPVLPAHLATYDVDAPCQWCQMLHAFDPDEAVAKYHAILASGCWRRERGVTTRTALPTRRR